MLGGWVMLFPGANYPLGNLDVLVGLGTELGNRINFKIMSHVLLFNNCQNCLHIQIETISYQALVEEEEVSIQSR